MTEKQFLSVKEAATIADKSTSWIRQRIREKKLRTRQPGSTGKHRRGGAAHVISRDDLLALLRPPPTTPTDLTAYEAKEPSK